MAQQNRRRCGNGKEGGMTERGGDVAGPVLLMPCPAVSDSGFACGANICSKFAAGIRRGQCRQQRTKRAGERGRLSSSSRRNWRKIYRCLKKKKRRDEIRQKDALPATAATLRRRRRQRWRQPLLNSAVHKIYDLLLVSAVGEGEQPARAKLVGGGLGGSALRLHFP